MLFVELRFFALFAIVFGLVWTLKSNEWRKRVLTLASYVFYGAWDWRFLGLILFVTAVSYAVGAVAEHRPPGDARRKRALTLGIVAALGVLGLFKYFNFFTDSFVDFAGLMGLSASSVTLNLVLPVGISFYTFQAISYMVDVHRGDVAAKRSVLDVAFYIAFFPQLVAGPIVRAATFIPQMDTPRRWADVSVRACLALFLIGFIKKACVSDNIAPYVDLIFADPSSYTAASVVGGVLLYAVQIYCDFSGYSDMAIATAGLLGYKFPANFDSPYLSPNIQDFWRRWHISLSSWLRDYLYIPLGGNRRGNARRDVNLMTTMLLGGLWHGASMNFVIWGGLHGGALIVERLWNTHVASRFSPMGWIGALIGTVVTFYWVNLAWIFFRARTLEESFVIAKTYLTWSSPGVETLPVPVWPILAGLGLFHYAANKLDAQALLARLSPDRFAMTYGVLAAASLSFVPLGYRPFIYFQF
ncbi:MAG: MBOAT family O-acyltransferase [Pseudomonadota bacterium]